MIHEVWEKKYRMLTGCVLLLSCAVLIEWGTGDMSRAVTALIAFSPCAFILAGTTAAASAELSLVHRGIFLRTNRILLPLGHTETIVFDTDSLRRAGSIDTAFPQIVTALRHMGLHPVLRADDDRQEAARIGAAAGITDIRSITDMESGALSSPIAVVDLHACPTHGSTIRVALHGIGSTTAADAVILGGDLHQIPRLVRMARRTRTKIEQNEIFGQTLGCIGIGLAAAGILTPLSGALWHTASALLILLNAGSLLSVGAREKKFAF